MDDKLEQAGQIFSLSRALAQSTGSPGSTAGDLASTAGGLWFCTVVKSWPFWYTLRTLKKWVGDLGNVNMGGSRVMCRGGGGNGDEHIQCWSKARGGQCVKKIRI